MKCRLLDPRDLHNGIADKIPEPVFEQMYYLLNRKTHYFFGLLNLLKRGKRKK